MKLFLPKQHGAWAMLFIPFWLGGFSGGLIWQHVPFFFGWLLLYLATYPALLLFKKKKNKASLYTKWTIIYMVPALLLLLVPLVTRPTIIYFGFVMIPFFILNAYYSSINNERALLNDISAIIVFGIAGLASSFLTLGELNEYSIIVFISTVLFFLGSTFYVKTMIREKKSKLYKGISWGYHSLLPIMWIVSGFSWVALAFIPSLLRAIYCYGKPYSVKKVGILEIVNAVLFFIILLIAMMI
ncbi:YwiC-like family protein [Bacillus sp. 31A1R]|uniref:YwiC-like family protein n=1 Tax=Robertmurraya mangrovi TaxID=3098077 RepID=A0ABU5IT36_9BACI|nr:YwiC-like family protein [Bacillus sp. 31A1R]MDZ5470317.1 YwiC-like family protein [Bacillus sp. 31A1R]